MFGCRREPTRTNQFFLPHGRFASDRSATGLRVAVNDLLPDVAAEHAAFKRRRLGIGGEEDDV